MMKSLTLRQVKHYLKAIMRQDGTDPQDFTKSDYERTWLIFVELMRPRFYKPTFTREQYPFSLN